MAVCFTLAWFLQVMISGDAENGSTTRNPVVHMMPPGMILLGMARQVVLNDVFTLHHGDIN